MFTCNGKQFDLDQLFQFQMLKEILKALCQNNLEMRVEINNLKSKINNHHENSEKKFDTIESNFNNLSKTINDIMKGNPPQENFELSKFPEEIPQPKEEEIKLETNQNLNYQQGKIDISKNENLTQTNIISTEKNKEEKLNNLPISNLTINTNENLNENETQILKENENQIPIEQPQISPRKKKLQDSLKNMEMKPIVNVSNFQEALKNIQDDEKEEDDTSKLKVSPELMRILSKKIRDNQKKIAILEKFVNDLLESSSQNDKNLKIMKNIFEEHENDNENDFGLINNNLQNLTTNARRNSKIIEELQVKVSDMDIFNVIKDSGDGNVDASKLLIRALETRINKRLDLNDEKYKNDQIEFMKVKNQTINQGNLIDVLQRNVNNMKENIENLNNEFVIDIKNLKDKYEALHQLMNENKENLNKDINESKESSKNYTDEREKVILEEISKQLKSLTGKEVQITTHHEEKVNPQDFSLLEKKVNDIRKKLNDLDNDFKIHINSKDIDELRKSIKDIKYDLDSKLVHSDLKELYDHHLSDLDQINDAKDNLSFLNEDTKKLFSEVQDLYHRHEVLLGHVNSIKSSQHGEKGILGFDVSQFIDQEKFMQSTKELYKELDRLKKQDQSMQRGISDIYDKLKHMPTNDNIRELEFLLTQNLNDFKVVCKKTYSDKNDVIRNIKTLEIQIKQVAEEQIKKQENGDNWLLSKRPLTLKCASCEADLNNLNPKTEFLPWNKYPQREENKLKKGPGFSHVLQMMAPELIKTYETKEFSSDNENKFDGQIGNSSSRILNKDNIGSNRIKLPKVNKSVNIRNIGEEIPPISDEEETTDINKGGKKDIENSPKIVKITKFKQYVNSNSNINQGNEEGKRKRNVNNVQITIDSSNNNNNYGSSSLTLNN